ncbi:glycosyltransferase [Aquicoccus sp. SU-CL01552]|uniref:glycosyltransferase n=1 Tax=Aquicoccus sp. SU-CL01552 TaxID=3127656 RepID=UPI00310A4440
MCENLISILLPDLRGGGAERVNIDLAHEFVRAGHTVEFVLMQARGELLEEARDSFSVVDLATPRARAVPLALARYLRRRRPDALLAAMWPLTVIAPVARRLSGHRCKVLVSEHNTMSVQYADWGRLHRVAMRASMAVGYPLADCRVGVSLGVVKDISGLSGLRPEAFDVIHNPVPPRPEPPARSMEDAEALWAAPKGARIVTVGSMKAQKNHPLLLRAFARIDRPDARLMFVGDGDGRDALLSLARDLGVANRVILAGFHPDPTPFYKTADLFALSSDYEGFGNVIVEAMACGTPVVSTDCPSGPGEILEEGRYGRLVPVGDAGAMAHAIGASLEDRVPAEQLQNRAAEFSPKRAAAAYLEQIG